MIGFFPILAVPLVSAQPTKANGARLGWLLIPRQLAVEVWPASGDPQRFEGLAVLEAGQEFPGLQLSLMRSGLAEP